MGALLRAGAGGPDRGGSPGPLRVARPAGSGRPARAGRCRPPVRPAAARQAPRHGVRALAVSRPPRPLADRKPPIHRPRSGARCPASRPKRCEMSCILPGLQACLCPAPEPSAQAVGAGRDRRLRSGARARLPGLSLSVPRAVGWRRWGCAAACAGLASLELRVVSARKNYGESGVCEGQSCTRDRSEQKHTLAEETQQASVSSTPMRAAE